MLQELKICPECWTKLRKNRDSCNPKLDHAHRQFAIVRSWFEEKISSNFGSMQRAFVMATGTSMSDKVDDWSANIKITVTGQNCANTVTVAIPNWTMHTSNLPS